MAAGPRYISVSSLDHKDGSYTVSYRAVKAGKYTLRVILSVSTVTTDFSVTVTAGPTYPPTSLVSGRGAVGSVAGVRAHLVIAARDANGNKRTLGGDVISAGMQRGVVSGASARPAYPSEAFSVFRTRITTCCP